jgi:hypothetical protein
MNSQFIGTLAIITTKQRSKRGKIPIIPFRKRIPHHIYTIYAHIAYRKRAHITMDGATEVKKGDPEVSRKTCRSESIYLKISITKLTILRSAKVSKSISLGTSAAASLRRVEAIVDPANNSFPAIARGSSSTICVSFALHCKCRLGLGKRGRRGEKTNDSILCLRSVGPIKKFYRNGKGPLCNPNGL